MEADWEVEIGAGAAVVEPEWAGFVDLRQRPQAAGQLPEAATLPGLAQVLVRLNAEDSPVWTAKCDVWQMDGFDPLELDVESAGDQRGIACYVDLLPREDAKWSAHADAVEWCRLACGRLHAIALRGCRVDLVVRAAALAAERIGIAVTAYVCAAGIDSPEAQRRLAQALAALADTLVQSAWPRESAKKLQ